MDQRTRKLMSRHKAWYPRDDVDRLYLSRKEGGRGLASIEDSVYASIQWLEDYTEKHKERLITATKNNTDNMRINRTKQLENKKWEEKQLYGHFKQQTTECWLVGWVLWHINLCRLCQIYFYANSQLYFKQFSLAWVHSLIVKTVVIQLIQLSISTDFVHTVKCQNSSILNNSI